MKGLRAINETSLSAQKYKKRKKAQVPKKDKRMKKNKRPKCHKRKEKEANVLTKILKK